eukprot:2658401-Rhodomonas_salina.3
MPTLSASPRASFDTNSIHHHAPSSRPATARPAIRRANSCGEEELQRAKSLGGAVGGAGGRGGGSPKSEVLLLPGAVLGGVFAGRRRECVEFGRVSCAICMGRALCNDQELIRVMPLPGDKRAGWAWSLGLRCIAETQRGEKRERRRKCKRRPERQRLWKRRGRGGGRGSGSNERRRRMSRRRTTSTCQVREPIALRARSAVPGTDRAHDAPSQERIRGHFAPPQVCAAPVYARRAAKYGCSARRARRYSFVAATRSLRGSCAD